MSDEAWIFFRGKRAGTLTRQRSPITQYEFTYIKDYLQDAEATPVSNALPLTAESYSSRFLHPFFDNLIPEGWLLDIAVANWKIDRMDRFALLLATCQDCIGAVQIFKPGHQVVETKRKSLPLVVVNNKPLDIKRCLRCLDSLNQGEELYHKRCCKLLFNTEVPPTIEVSSDNIEELAVQVINQRLAMTGVQRKLSLSIDQKGTKPHLTIAGLWGDYILKPSSSQYESIAANEHLMILVSRSLGFPTEESGLIPLRSGELAFIARRFDRGPRRRRYPCEDFCQLSGRPPNEKYDGSVEQLGKVIDKYSFVPGADKLLLFSHCVLAFLVGNADMHNKNYSLLTSALKRNSPERIHLAPAYDLVSTDLIIEGDKEESALTINGKKARLKRADFFQLAKSLEIPEGVYEKRIDAITSRGALISDLCKRSFLPKVAQQKLLAIIDTRRRRLL